MSPLRSTRTGELASGVGAEVGAGRSSAGGGGSTGGDTGSTGAGSNPGGPAYVPPERVTEGHHALEIVDHTIVRDLQGGPLRPVEGVVHEGLHLVVAEDGEAVEIMGDRDPVSMSSQPWQRSCIQPA
jgi:hypothetical protein